MPYSETQIPKVLNKSKECVVADCTNKRFNGELCNAHYKKKRKYGDPLAFKQIHNRGKGRTANERFWSRVIKTSDFRDCWLWGAGLSKQGYGKARVTTPDGQVIERAHRVAYYLHNGTVPILPVLHSCDNPRCVNPQHLREGTALENSQDMVAKGRSNRGRNVHTAKITELQVKEIRRQRQQGLSYRQIGERYGIGITAVSAITNNISWKHVK